MFPKENEVLDLGNYKRFKIRECMKEKANALVLDEGGLSSPLSVSLVIPTKFESENIEDIEERTLHRILAQCSKLVDKGYLDEIIVVGATRDAKGEPDVSILQKVTKIAYEELGLFREQVNLLNKYKSQNGKAKRGSINFFLKTVHQFDRNISKLLAKYGIFGSTGYFGMSPGKGSGIWLSVPITQGDVVCFVDSDIVNFQKEFVIGLCHPIIYSWNTQEAAIKFVKAYYNRVTLTKNNMQTPILGGRVCRLLAIPLLKTITEYFNLYVGLESIKYPLAGESAFSRDLLEQLSFPNTYAMETSFLFQTYDLIGPSSIAQLNLSTYHHLGQEFENLESMVYQIADYVFRVVDEKLGRVLTNREKEKLVSLYQKNVRQLVKKYEKKALRLKEKGENLTYLKEKEIEKTFRFEKIIRDILAGKSTGNTSRYFSSLSWRRINEKTGNYFILKEMLRRRSNQSTWSRLRESDLVSE